MLGNPLKTLLGNSFTQIQYGNINKNWQNKYDMATQIQLQGDTNTAWQHQCIKNMTTQILYYVACRRVQ